MLPQTENEEPGFLDFVDRNPEEVAGDAVLVILMAEYRRVKYQACREKISTADYVWQCLDIVQTVRSRAAGRKLLQNYLNNY